MKDSNGNTIASADVTYQWYLNNKAIEGATSASYTIPADAQTGDLYKVIVTDAEGKTFESDAAIVSKEVVAATLLDEDGLQSDGTALLADTLRVTYTSDLGNPTQVTWYRDGTAISSTTTTTVGGLVFTSPATANVAGTYYAVITNTEGKTFASNSIVKTSEEVGVTMSGFTLENYEGYAESGAGAAYIPSLTTRTDTIIATVTLNKQVLGDFYLYRNGDKTDKAIVPVHDTIDAVATSADFDVVTVRNALTNKALIDKCAAAGATAKGIRFKNDDGSWTYKFVVDEDVTYGDDTTLTRGEKYILGFDQTSANVLDDVTAGTGVKAGHTANITTAVEAPYLTAPASIKVKNFTQGTTEAKIAFLNADGEEMTWLGAAAALNTPVAGFDKISLYNITSVTPAADDVALNYTNNTLVKGVATITVGTGFANKYCYAKYDTTAGIFGATTATLSTGNAETAVAPATKITVSQDKDTPTSAVVEFSNLSSRAKGKVYILKAKSNDEYTDAAATAITAAGNTDKVFLKEAGIKDGHVVAEADVDPSVSSKVVIPNALSKTYMGSVNQTAAAAYTAGYKADGTEAGGSAVTANNTTFENAWEAACYQCGQYGAIFVPEDSAAYTTMISDNDADVAGSQPFFLTESVKSWKLSGTVEFKTIGNKDTTDDAVVGNDTISATLQGVNQFGDNVTANLATELAGGVAFKATADTTTNIGTPTLAISATGVITVAAITEKTAVKTSDSWIVKTSYGTFTLGVKTAGNTAEDKDANDAATGAVFTLTYAK